MSTDRPVYAVGDIHGQLDELDRVLRLIKADADSLGVARPRVVFTGDYVDRGPDSRGVLDRLASRKVNEVLDCVFCGGNHDYSAFSALQGNQRVWINWLGIGGMEMVQSYGVAVKDRPVERFMAEFMRAVPAAHLQFLASMRPYHHENGLFFCHAGLSPKHSLEEQPPEVLAWGDKDFLTSSRSYGNMRVVHGHWITKEVDARPNRVGIDTGCGSPGGKLSAVAFHAGGRLRILGQGRGRTWTGA